mgnify:CR=1 FL=1
MTFDELLRSSDLSRDEAEKILLHVLSRTSAWLYARGKEAVPESVKTQFSGLAKDRLAGEPLAYLMGYRDFCDLRLQVDSSVLIPRRETEHLVEWVLELLEKGAVNLLDLGCGSGAIGLASKASCPAASVTCTDRSDELLKCAQLNAANLNLSVNWVVANWFDGLPSEKWDVIASNPPYVAPNDPHLLEGDLPAEPRYALVGGGCDGLDSLRAIILAAPPFLVSEGWLLLEHGCTQGPEVRRLLRNRGFSSITTRRDWSRLERITGAQWCN